MEIVATTGEAGRLVIPISLIFWGYVAAYVVHILEESLLGENFVEMVRRSFSPRFEWKHFAVFNTLLMSVTVLSIILYEVLGGSWILLPLSWAFMFTTNGLWHLGATLLSRRYSPGLLTSILYWLLFSFVVRYAYLPGEIPDGQFLISGVAGTTITVVMIGMMFSMRRFGADQADSATTG